MCIYFLLGNCEFGSSACVYAHDKAYLPTGHWWENKNKRLAMQRKLTSLHLDEIPKAIPDFLAVLDHRLVWTDESPHRFEMDPSFVSSSSRAQSRQAFDDYIKSNMTTACINIGPGGSSEDERDERAGGSGRNINIVIGGTGQIIQFNNEDEWDSWIKERMNVNDCGVTEDEEM